MSTQNERRAIESERTLREAEYGDSDVNEDDWFTAVGDMPSDLRHAADHRSFDFDAAVEDSSRHHGVEAEEDEYGTQDVD